MLATLDAARPDLVCLAGFMRILSPHVVDAYADRMLNIHPSLLPAHPGLDTHARARLRRVMRRRAARCTR